MLVETVVLVILILLSALFSGSEIALFSLSDIKVKKLIRQRKRGAKTLKKIKENPHKLLITILIGNNLVNISAASFATIVFTNMFGSLGIGLATGIMTFFILVFGEIFPKSFCYQNAERMSLFFATPLYILMKLLYPVVIFIEKLSLILLDLFERRKKERKISEDEIKAALSMGVEAGIIERDEEEMIHNIFEFGDTTVSEVMTPRKDIIAVRYDAKLMEALPEIIKSKYSRIPIYKGGLDNIIGILHVKDVLKYLKKGQHDIHVSTISSPVMFIPENKNLDLLLDEFRESGTHIAIVKDRKGKVKGLVTLEDLLEEIVGEIYDESDISKTNIRILDKRTMMVKPDTSLEDVEKLTGLKYKGGLKTIGELITKLLGKPAKKGDIIRLKNFKLVVKDANKNEGLKWIKIVKIRGKIKR
ncbi:MAG: HlyC/CorC family transporter [Candidatus Aenigmarchaeota archaeon]|nr:HlyC/CorC family transporter [Candidatus Aenigmarchaeota archaeon]